MPNLYKNQSSNIAKTWGLMAGFLVLVIGIGWLITYVYNNPIFLYVAIAFSVVMNFFAFWFSDKVALKQQAAQEAPFEGNEELHRIVENLAITAGLPKPRIYIINDNVPNAFATGRNPDNSAVAVTTGLLRDLDRVELEGVIAHELAHIGNRDILVMTIAVVLAGFISLVADFLMRGALFGDQRNSNVVIIIAAIALTILASVFATLLQMAVSRRREYLADATAGLMTRYPEGLASALEKISQYKTPMQRSSKATAHLFIANPFGPGKNLKGLFSTHPPIEKRIAALRSTEEKD